MRAKSNLAILFLLMISALAFYVFAQVQSDKQQEEMRKSLLLQKSQFQNQSDKLQEETKKAVRKTILIDKQVITLFQARVQRDGFIDAITESGKTEAFRNATLRIIMMDGSVQEIPLVNVKEVAIEQSGNIR
jgi:hypothetical protein